MAVAPWGRLKLNGIYKINGIYRSGTADAFFAERNSAAAADGALGSACFQHAGLGTRPRSFEKAFAASEN